MKKAVILMVVLLFSAQVTYADGGPGVVGTWQLLSLDIEFQDGRPARAQYGKNPIGYLIYTKEGRIMTVIESEGREAAKTDEERAALIRTMFAYAGTYRAEGDKVTVKIDAAWNPVWRGSERASTVKVEGDRLYSTTPWSPAPNLPGAPITRGVTTWKRIN